MFLFIYFYSTYTNVQELDPSHKHKPKKVKKRGKLC